MNLERQNSIWSSPSCACGDSTDIDLTHFTDGRLKSTDIIGGNELISSPHSMVDSPVALSESQDCSLMNYYTSSIPGTSKAFGGRNQHSRKDIPVADDGEDHSLPLAKSSAAGSKVDTMTVLNRVGTDTSECSATVARGKCDPCSSHRMLRAIKKFAEQSSDGDTTDRTPAPESTLPKASTDEAQAVRRAALVLGCNSESCIVTHPKFRSFVAGLENIGGTHLLDIELDRRFKTEGPRNSTHLLSNFNIDGVLQEWAVTFPEFYNYNFNMMDFEVVGGSLARTDVAGILEGRESQNLGKMGGLIQRPCNTFGCVLNTDVSTGHGKHWVAVFGDCRGEGEWTVEYFNSAGNAPPGPVTRWLENSAARLMEYRMAHPRKFGVGEVTSIPLTDIRHQDSQTECGLYTLYYIRRRLEGAPLSEFRSARIPDNAMVEFRKHIFRVSEHNIK